MDNLTDLLASISISEIPESLKEESTTGTDTPIVEKYIRLNNHLIKLQRKAIPPKVRETTPVFRWRIPRIDCRHVASEYDDCCGVTNLALDKLEDHINGDIAWPEFVDAWQKAKAICPNLD